jgi:hypothetical protein
LGAGAQLLYLSENREIFLSTQISLVGSLDFDNRYFVGHPAKSDIKAPTGWWVLLYTA